MPLVTLIALFSSYYRGLAVIVDSGRKAIFNKGYFTHKSTIAITKQSSISTTILIKRLLVILGASIFHLTRVRANRGYID